MSDTKVSALTAAGSFLSADEIPVNEAGTSKKVTGTQISAWIKALYATPVQFQPAAPTGRAGAAVMMGLGTTCVFTPKFTGRILVSFIGGVSNSITLDGANFALFYGTGTAPANAAAITGTQATPTQTATNGTGVSTFPFALIASQTGLTLNTAYWFDISLASVTGGTASLSALNFTCVEV